MEFEKGMYVRTPRGITKINMPDKLVYMIRTENFDYISKRQILKASHNIIDLIEVGDVISTNNLCGQVTSIEGDKIYTTCYDGECCYDYQIQSIVTKEQFSKMEYKID